MSEDSSKRGDFFAIDRDCWPGALGLGMNAAVAYLVMARGTRGDQKTTSWSVNAIEKYTSISRPKAVIAIEALKSAKLLRVIKGGTRPRYELTMPSLKKDNEIGGGGWFWLPNSLVDGAPGNAIAPVELLRQTQSTPALKLLVEMYGATNMQYGAGVDHRAIRQEYDRHKAGEHGQFAIWCFTENQPTAWRNVPPAKLFMTRNAETNGERRGKDKGWQVFFDALGLLITVGLLEFIPHILESDTDDAEIFSPMAFDSGEPGERHIGKAANAAAFRMLGDNVADAIQDQHGGRLIPLPLHLVNAQMIGIARLKYRPRTNATAA